jgi:hypothetical protein
MKSWWLPWLCPLVLIGGVVLVAVLGDYAVYLAAPLGFVGVVGICLLWRARFGPSKDDPDADVHYWRLPGPRPRS